VQLFRQGLLAQQFSVKLLSLWPRFVQAMPLKKVVEMRFFAVVKLGQLARFHCLVKIPR